ncbi:uncharacterized protein LOC123540997 [Mercenaria mercenaria]|uniref:uncharacterized protein LOC123540997 n=1 Tax=Mercenaria mercenaria TaxID=6596 RepID=UPI00234E3E75|nr:uncharacterized protein LOC123540997 [Mercenaria mercenaria]
MKFRQFEFRLFPRIRSRKKKKTKFSHTDYPRDISLDKNCNLYKTDFPCFYDNLAVDAAISEQFPGYVLCRNNNAVLDNFGKSYNDDINTKTFPLNELKIDIDSTCSCTQCAHLTENLPSEQTACGVLSETCTRTSVGTPNTIPRSRTRIKTNPWLPSPRSTPSPSPTDQHVIAYPAGYEESDIMYATRPSTLPLFSSHNSNFYASVRALTTPSTGLAEIPETEILHDGLNRKLYDRGGEYLYKTIKKESKPVFAKGGRQSPVNSLLKDDPNYETDVSSCGSPLNEFLKCVKYEIDFSYERIADDMLESSTFPRDDSFNSSINTNTDIPEIEKLDGADKIACQTKIEDDADITFDDTNNNMQESIDTGYASVSRDSDFMSSDDEFGMKSESKCEMKDVDSTNDAHDDYHSIDSKENSNMKIMSESPEVYESHFTRKTDYDVTDYDTDIDHEIDIDQISDYSHTSELEWDDEPMTKTLILEFPHVISAQNGDTSYDSPISEKDDSVRQPIKRYSSVKYRRNKGHYLENDCTCHRRRSRSLADIQLSLDEKVILLREEKTYVQRKIHEAILEEKLKEHQMKIFRLLSGDQKKQLIVKTLHDLKSRLEDQSARLQSSYNTVISLQNMYLKRRNDRMCEDIDY